MDFKFNLFGRQLAQSIILLISTATTCAQVPMPVKYDSSVKVNYIRVWEPVKPYSDDEDVMSISRTLQEVRQNTQYFDGLGRALQTVIRRGSLVTGDTARDLVAPQVYDDYGREMYKYLSFAANNTNNNNSISDGRFKLNPFQQDSAFNKGIFSDENYFYSKSVFEASPLHRVREQFAPGNSWVGTAAESSETNRRSIKTKYWINTAADSVRVWAVSNIANSFGSYSTTSIYTPGSLFKRIVQDEHNKQVMEFTDMEGKVLLKKVQLSADADTGTGRNHTGWLCTYYIYDDLNNLRAVIQPKGVELLAVSGWSLTSTILNELCFRYEYDERSRLIMKKVPGAGIVYLIYDARDRLVMTQDSLLRASYKWLYTLYDGLNRPITTGSITDYTYYNNPSYHRSQASNNTSYPNVGSYTNEELTETYYDDYSWRSGEGNPLTNTRSTATDGYLLTPSGSWPYPQNATIQSNQLKGSVTGSKTKVLGSGTFLYSLNFYDDKGRIIQTQSTNISGGTDVASSQYSWTGQVLMSILKHEKSGTNPQTITILTKTTYDDLFRQIKTEKKISSTIVNSGTMPGTWTTLNELEYDALGQLKKKKLGGKPLETLNYEYSIRGWMLGMNRGYVKDTTSTANWFGFDLGFDKTSFTVNGTEHSYSAAQYNGNINGMLWRSTGDDLLRKYDFTYDAANRFLSADFNQLNNNSFSKAAKIDFSVFGMSYDANGNILTMNQKGCKVGGSVTIDSLLYGYNSVSNRLHYVNDRANSTDSRLGDFKEINNNTSQDYSYDGNGNIYADNNKSIAFIRYNHFNLPDSIAVTGKGSITYTYDATGSKLKKVTKEGVLITSTVYLFGNYVNDTLQYLPHEEGRIRFKKADSTFQYDYFVKDHLGNVRMVLTEEADTSFYPAATMEEEGGAPELENLFYSNIEATRFDRPEEFNDEYSEPNDKVAHVIGEEAVTIGPAIALRVMAGDKINIRVSSYWSNEYPPSSPINPLPSLLEGLENSIGGITGTHNGPTIQELNASSVLLSGAASFLGSQPTSEEAPDAFVNWILFDDRFNYVSSSSGYEHVGEADETVVHSLNDLLISKSGYFYVYVSNATENISVFFDNLQVTHIRGSLLEETHYYPFGLVMQGISSKALSLEAPKNKKGYAGNELQNKEFTDGSGLEFYDFNARTYDQQIGRFLQIDPLSEEGDQEGWGPYHYSYNNPVTYSDPDGKIPIPLVWVIIAALTSETTVAVVATGTLAVTATAVVLDQAQDVSNNVTMTQGQGRGIITGSPLLMGTGGYYPNSQKSSTNSIEAGSTSSSVGRWAAKANSTSNSSGTGRSGGSSNTESGGGRGGSSSGGRSGKQEKLKEIVNDPKAGKSDKGWIKQELNSINRGNRQSIRVPPGKNLAHDRGKEARNGYSYKHSKLQDIDLHKNQHRVERRFSIHRLR